MACVCLTKRVLANDLAINLLQTPYVIRAHLGSDDDAFGSPLCILTRPWRTLAVLAHTCF